MGQNTKPPKTPPAPQQQVVIPKEETIVHMNCRGKPGCPGQKQKLVFTLNISMLQGGGTLFRYRCITCGSTWTITR